MLAEKHSNEVCMFNVQEVWQLTILIFKYKKYSVDTITFKIYI